MKKMWKWAVLPVGILGGIGILFQSFELNFLIFWRGIMFSLITVLCGTGIFYWIIEFDKEKAEAFWKKFSSLVWKFPGGSLIMSYILLAANIGIYQLILQKQELYGGIFLLMMLGILFGGYLVFGFGVLGIYLGNMNVKLIKNLLLKDLMPCLSVVFSIIFLNTTAAGILFENEIAAMIILLVMVCCVFAFEIICLANWEPTYVKDKMVK